ncbi:MAG: MarR family winged helix-turn-helix transcriptional regulator [Flavipsychrobacter sp.]
MSKTIFNPEEQELDLSKKVTVGLERISAAFKALLWDKAKQFELSPIQIQVLIFISYHQKEYCTVSYLAKEFNVTKATLSDAIKSLDSKRLVKKDHLAEDSRSYYIQLTTRGRKVVQETESFSAPISQQISDAKNSDLEILYKYISQLVYQLNQKGVLSVQRVCFTCQYYSQSKGKSYCNMLKKPLKATEIRLDCPEHIETL